MGWNQWALLRFANKTYDDTLKLKFPNKGDHWGWPFEDTKDTSTRNQIEYSTIEEKDIEPQTTYAYGQTGKQNEWAGMEGTVDIYTKATAGTKEQKIARNYYSCPWSGSNKFSISGTASGWKVDQWGADYNGDALGSITIEVRRT
ncbi:hypothetical protein NCS57_00978600 [Fusarium keratoplasticum]|uniref:Uncharacterized protein n=1 Tax=Fusarium keratoplasticum TaxID=1328300 RepID=A0ACC0QT23_9HYPO|nr:hypothetical protein NCS57_00978600 [Fusarium keratoplasticum]KAI8663764.1 hypothetical protein NCS57_00978600 [Fusarium keratoplasticum]